MASQTLVAGAGLGLIAANYWLGGAKATVTAGTINKSATADQTAQAHHQIKIVAAELLFVGIATLIAGISGSAASAMLAVIIALAVLWSIQHYTGKVS